MVVIPASEGELGVLPGHAPMIVLLRGGVIRLYQGAQVTARLFVAGGFAEITTEACTILANEAVPVAEVSRSVAEKRLAEAEAAWQSVDKMDMPAIDAVLDRLQSARAMLEAAEAA
jgi:F-type H+-transporting ATPase subunit epsilon